MGGHRGHGDTGGAGGHGKDMGGRGDAGTRTPVRRDPEVQPVVVLDEAASVGTERQELGWGAGGSLGGCTPKPPWVPRTPPRTPYLTWGGGTGTPRTCPPTRPPGNSSTPPASRSSPTQRRRKRRRPGAGNTPCGGRGAPALRPPHQNMLGTPPEPPRPQGPLRGPPRTPCPNPYNPLQTPRDPPFRIPRDAPGDPQTLRDPPRDPPEPL